MHPTDRRTFLTAACAVALSLWAAPVRGLSRLAPAPGPEHPDPRPGIDARDVTPRALVADDAAATFDRVREIPHVVDGIACQCGCHPLQEMRSLLSCFEGHGMAQHCVFCQGQADLAYEMHRAGRSLVEIRAAVEAEFGS